MKKNSSIFLLASLLSVPWLLAAPGDGPSLNIGTNNVVPANSASGVFGSYNQPSLFGSLTLGTGNGWTSGFVGYNSIVGGNENFYDVGGDYVVEASLVVGSGNTGNYEGSTSYGPIISSLVVGEFNAASIFSGMVVGTNNIANAHSFVLGDGLIAESWDQPMIVLGQYNEFEGLPNKTILFGVGNGYVPSVGSPVRRNALEIYADGETVFRAPVKIFNGAANTGGIVLDPVDPKITIGGAPVLTATSSLAQTFTAPSFSFNSGAANRLAIDASGNVGIGMASPGFRLDVAGSNTAARIASDAGWTGSGTAALVLGKTSSAGRLGLAGSGGSVMSTYGFSSASDAAEIRASHLGAGGYFSWYTTSGTTAERMRIANGGNVGIGTTAPPAKLSVQGSGSGSGLAALFTDVNGTGGSQVAILDNGRVGLGTTAPNTVFHVVRSTTTAPVTLKVQNIAAASTNAGAELLLGTSSNVATDSVGASILASRTDAAAAGDTDLVVRNSAGSTMSERVRIKADGKVGIGTSSPQATLDVNGTAKISGAVTMSRQGDVGMGRFAGSSTDQ